MPDTYRKKPIELQAIQWTGDNADAINDWCGWKFDLVDPEDRGDNPDHTAQVFVDANSVWIGIETGEWILKDRKGFYPCKPDVFAETYEPVQSTTAPEENR
jgi:hypothetical protein